MESSLAPYVPSTLANHIGKVYGLIVLQVLEGCEQLCLRPLAPSHTVLSKPSAFIFSQ